MSELNDRQNVILQAWAKNEMVIGYNGGEFGIEHAMMNAVIGVHAKEISKSMFENDHDNAGDSLHEGVKVVARELASAHMGYPYLSDAEEAMKEKAGE